MVTSTTKPLVDALAQIPFADPTSKFHQLVGAFATSIAVLKILQRSESTTVASAIAFVLIALALLDTKSTTVIASAGVFELVQMANR
jgi:cytochrome c oxidase assembly factor CtaG